MRRLSGMICFLMLPVAAFARDYRFDEHRKITKNFSVDTAAGNGPTLLVDNIEGAIRVTGAKTKAIRIDAEIRYRAETAEALEEAKHDTVLDLNQQGNRARAYLDGPFRQKNWRGERYAGYSVSVEFDIEVPTNTEVILKTVNGGTVSLTNTSGDFEIHNVNGAIALNRVSGSGTSTTVNGPVTARFSRNPTRATAFHTVNGEIEAHFEAPLSADLTFQTMNGQVYGDPGITPIGKSSSEGERKDGKFFYRADRLSHARAGQGGPELKFETLNGNIRLYTSGK